MNDLLPATAGYLPSLLVRLGLVVLTTFLAAAGVAQVFGDRLPREDRSAQRAASCGSGTCPSILPCGLPISTFEVRGEVPTCCEPETPADS